MSAIKSAYLRTRIVKHILGILSFTMPTNTYVALYTTDPTVSDTGTEVTGGSYARQLVSWGTESGGVVPSNAVINFTNMPTTSVTHWGLRDASSAGNLLYFGALDIAVDKLAGETFSVASGDLSIAER